MALKTQTAEQFQPRFVAIADANTLIPNGTALTPGCDLYGTNLTAVLMPSVWTAAVLTFLISVDGTTWVSLYNADGTEYVVQAGASQCITLSPDDFDAFRFVQVRSGTSASPVNQGADRQLTLIVRPLF